MKEYVVPRSWSFDEQGNLKSFEYLATDSPMATPTQSFADEVFSELKKLGLERNLGIRRIDNIIGKSSWETTPDGTRSNVVVFGTQPDSVTDQKTVSWYFDINGTIHKGERCSCTVS